MSKDTNQKNRLALVIGSGSVKCAAGLGMFKVLQREGISADLVALVVDPPEVVEPSALD